MGVERRQWKLCPQYSFQVALDLLTTICSTPVTLAAATSRKLSAEELPVGDVELDDERLSRLFGAGRLQFDASLNLIATLELMCEVKAEKEISLVDSRVGSLQQKLLSVHR